MANIVPDSFKTGLLKGTCLILILLEMEETLSNLPYIQA